MLSTLKISCIGKLLSEQRSSAILQQSILHLLASLDQVFQVHGLVTSNMSSFYASCNCVICQSSSFTIPRYFLSEISNCYNVSVTIDILTIVYGTGWFIQVVGYSIHKLFNHKKTEIRLTSCVLSPILIQPYHSN